MSTTSVVADALAAQAAQYPSTVVEGRSPDSFVFDVGALLAVDPAPLEPRRYAVQGPAAREAYLQSRARDAMQLLINELWQLPVEQGTLDVVAELPPRRTVVPRMTRMPTPKAAETRFDQFMRQKGVQKRTKRDRMVFDEATGEARPRWGMGRVGALDDEWVIEERNTEAHQQALSEGSDPFALKVKEKRDRVKKQGERQSRNIRSQQKALGTLAGSLASGRLAKGADSKAGLQAALAIAQRSSASMGKFDKRLEGEKAPRRPVRFADVAPASGGSQEERGTSLKLLDRVLRGPVGSKAQDVVSHGKAAKQAVTQQSAKRAGVVKKGKRR